MFACDVAFAGQAIQAIDTAWLNTGVTRARSGPWDQVVGWDARLMWWLNKRADATEKDECESIARSR